jgi:hypothetical protein
MPTTITRDGTPTSLLGRAAQLTMEREARGTTFTIAIRFTNDGDLGFTTIIPTIFVPLALTAGFIIDTTQTFDRWQDAREHEMDMWRVTIVD